MALPKVLSRAEVQQSQMPLRGDANVGRFQVMVDNLARVQKRQRVAQRDRPFECPQAGQGMALQNNIVQSRPDNKLLGNIEVTVVLESFVECRHQRVRACLHPDRPLPVKQGLQRGGVARVTRRKELFERNLPPGRRRVAGKVDRAVSALADNAFNDVLGVMPRHGFPGGQQHDIVVSFPFRHSFSTFPPPNP